MSYTQRLVSIRELFESEKTREPSEKALRARVEQGILVYVEANGGVFQYDETLSVIRVVAARQCKKPKVLWKDIGRALENVSLTHDRIIDLLNEGKSEAAIIEMLKNELRRILDN